MRRRVFVRVLASALLGLGTLAATAAASVRVHVSPSLGKPTTKFVVRFRAPSATSVALHRRYELYANGTPGKRCTSGVSMAIKATNAGSQVRVTLKPKGRRGVWCAGIFQGRIVEYITNICQPIKTGIACAAIMIAPLTIGRFSFRVKGSSSACTGRTGTQTTAPSFAGCRAPPPAARSSSRSRRKGSTS
jgi:hypothetical protein